MQKPRDIEIVESDPFENDLLDRESEIKNLTSIVLNYNDPLVLALDAPWGSGKTTFVRLWQAYLKQKVNQSICFNAWETDFADDPLIVLVSELDKWIKASKNDPIITKWRKGIKNAFPGVIKRTAVVATKFATFGALDVSAEYERTAADFTEKVAADLLENFDKQKKSIQQFKELITEILGALPKDQKNLIIFIDELDRCRPTYAIELLERIKHLFNIERLVFVLSTDTIQLTHSIRAIYGNDFDGKKYLQRFIDLDYMLKKPNPQKYLDKRFESLELNKILDGRAGIDDLDFIKNCFSVLINRFSLTARDINILLLRFRLILFSVLKNHFLDVPLLISLLILRDQNKSLYNKYTVSPNNADKVIDFLIDGKLYETESNESAALASMVGCLIAPNQRNQMEFDRLIQPYSKKIDNDLDYRDRMVIAWAENPRKNSMGRGFNHMLTIERIELVHQINIAA